VEMHACNISLFESTYENKASQFHIFQVKLYQMNKHSSNGFFVKDQGYDL